VWVTPSDYAALGRCLAEVRRQAGVSQDELAARLQKPQSFVSAYERGQRRVDVLELLLILGALGAEPHEVFAKIVNQIRPGEQRRRSRRPGAP
jgi:transcriptional regulator with XRE-family HTH domain